MRQKQTTGSGFAAAVRPQLTVAWAEFRKDLFFARTGAPGAFDFLWLSLFSGLTLFLVFLFWSALHSVRERFEQVLLGADSRAGIPIHLGRHIDLRGGITPAVLEAFRKRFPHLVIAPVREFNPEMGALTIAGLGQTAASGESDTTVRRDTGMGEELLALALPIESPLWQSILRRAGRPSPAPASFPRLIAASHHVFKTHFRYPVYRTGVATETASVCALLNRLPPNIGIGRLKSLDRFIVSVREHANPPPISHEFDVVWVESFPLPDQVALIVPLSTYDLIDSAKDRPQSLLHLEGGGAAAARIRKIVLQNIDRDEGKAAVPHFERLAQCLGAARDAAASSKGATDTWTVGRRCGVAAGSRHIRLTVPLTGDAPKAPSARGPRGAAAREIFDMALDLDTPLPADRVHMCRDAVRGPASPGKDAVFEWDYTGRSHTFAWLGDGRMSAPCAALIEADSKRADLYAKEAGEQNRPDRTGGTGCSDASDTGTMYADAYRRAIVYVPRPAVSAARPAGPAFGAGHLDGVLRELLDWTYGDRKTPVFRLSPTYEMALVRFGVLSHIVQTIAQPIVAGAILLYVFLTGLMLATTFSHRRNQYGLLTMYGTGVWGLRLIVLTQIVLSLLAGGILGYGIATGVVSVVNTLLARSDAAGRAREIIGLDAETFLAHIGLVEAFALWLAMTLLTAGVGYFVLWLRGITTVKAPIELLRS